MHQGPYTDGHFFIPTFSYFTILYVHTLLYILLRDHWAGKCVTDPGLLIYCWVEKCGLESSCQA